MSGHENDPLPSSPQRKKTRIRNCLFNKDWLKMAEFKSWLARDNDKNLARCTLCKNSFSIKFDGVNAVAKHARGEKHKKRAQDTSTSKVLESFSPKKESTLVDKITIVELVKAFHTVKHGLSYNSSDCGAKLDRELYADSEVAPKIHLGRTKMEALVQNILSSYAVKTVVSQIIKEDLPFSIATDASNKGNRKFFPLAIRFFDDQARVRDHFLDFYEESDESSESIKDTIIEALAEFGLNIHNVCVYSADNASVNHGKNCSVHQKLTKLNSNIVKANCNAHVLHIAAKYSMKNLSFDVETLVLKVFSEFSCSVKKVAALKECFKYAQEEYQQILRHIPIRWLSLHNAVERLLKNWSGIKAYFLQEGEKNCERHVWSFLSDQTNESSERLTLPECYIHFAHHFLNIFQTAIKALETKSLEAPNLYDMMLRVRQDFETRKDQEFFGFAVRQALPHLNESEREIFKSEALETYARAIEYLEKWFDFDNSIFKKFSALKLNETLPSMDDIVNISAHLGIKIDGDALFDELSTLKQESSALSKYDNDVRTLDKWTKFFQAS